MALGAGSGFFLHGRLPKFLRRLPGRRTVWRALGVS